MLGGEGGHHKQRTRWEGSTAALWGPRSWRKSTACKRAHRGTPINAPDKPQITAAPGGLAKQSKRIVAFYGLSTDLLRNQ